jgi:SNF2 family DNA or RNA helicase
MQHTIRNSKSKFFLAVTKIRADRRLALTGTPFVNRAQDIYSLLSFLGMEPLDNRQIFQRAISQPLQNGQEIGLARLRTAMGCVSIRRSKHNIPQLKMVEKHVQLASVEFPKDDKHKQVYDALYGTVRVAMEAILKDNDNALRNYSSIFEKLLRLRQACCSALLLTPERREIALKVWKQVSSGKMQQALSAEEGLALLEKLKGQFNQELPECGICLEEFDQAEGTILKSCSHVFCKNCIQQVLLKSTGKCPYCRCEFCHADIVDMSTAESVAAKIVEEEEMATNEFGTPPKITALLQSIESTMKPVEKGVIFSQFTTYLDVIGDKMREAGHTFVRIDCSVPAQKRIECIQKFNAQDGPRFILCSLLASGTGINLTRGNHAFLMDCWWNEAMESQAMDRIHRINQTRTVNVTKFIMKGSIEERIVKMQQAKSMLAKGAMQKLTGNEKRKALLGDLKGLLQIDNGQD